MKVPALFGGGKSSSSNTLNKKKGHPSARINDESENRRHQQAVEAAGYKEYLDDADSSEPNMMTPEDTTTTIEALQQQQQPKQKRKVKKQIRVRKSDIESGLYGEEARRKSMQGMLQDDDEAAAATAATKKKKKRKSDKKSKSKKSSSQPRSNTELLFDEDGNAVVTPTKRKKKKVKQEKSSSNNDDDGFPSFPLREDVSEASMSIGEEFYPTKPSFDSDKLFAQKSDDSNPQSKPTTTTSRESNPWDKPPEAFMPMPEPLSSSDEDDRNTSSSKAAVRSVSPELRRDQASMLQARPTGSDMNASRRALPSMNDENPEPSRESILKDMQKFQRLVQEVQDALNVERSKTAIQQNITRRLQAERSSLVDTVGQEMEELKKENSQLKQDRRSIIGTFGQDLERLERENEMLKARLDSNATTTAQGISEEGASAQVISLQQQLHALESQLDEKELKIVSLEADNSDLKRDIEMAESMPAQRSASFSPRDPDESPNANAFKLREKLSDLEDIVRSKDIQI